MELESRRYNIMSQFGVWFSDDTDLQKLIYHSSRLARDINDEQERRRTAQMTVESRVPRGVPYRRR